MLLQSDIEGTAVAMKDMFYRHGRFAFEPDSVHYRADSVMHSKVEDLGMEAVTDWSSHHRHMGEASLGSGAAQSSEDEEGTAEWQTAGWLSSTPWDAPTERDVYHKLVTGAPVFRMLLHRK